MTIDQEAKRTLDLRLAQGAITLDEYRQVLREIGGDQAPLATARTPPLGALVHQVDDLFIYEQGLVVAGREKSFNDITRVDGGTSAFSINIVARSRRSTLSIAFRNGDSYYIDEERAYLGSKRHEAICRAVGLLKHRTFPLRVKQFVLELARVSELEIGKEAKSPFPNLLFGGMKAVGNFVHGAPPLGAVYLTIDGTLRSPMTNLKIRTCRESGVLELGLSRGNYINSSEVYAIETKPLIATENRSRAIYFTIFHEAGADVVMSVLDWFAMGGNEQGAA